MKGLRPQRPLALFERLRRHLDQRFRKQLSTGARDRPLAHKSTTIFDLIRGYSWQSGEVRNS
jgi:hypothetical protein